MPKERNKIQNVCDEWNSYMGAKIQKLEKQYEKDLDHIKSSNTRISTIFEGIAIFVNGYTVPPADKLRQLMLAHGGIYHHYYMKNKTTHIIATNLATTKFKQITTEKVVHPEWILDSIEAKKLLPYQQYILSNPVKQQQKTLPFSDEFKNKNSVSQTYSLNEASDSSGEGSHSTTQLVAEVISDGKNVSPDMKNRTAFCTKDSGFLSEFYSHSRLHHISSMGAEFKNYVQQLQQNTDSDFPGRKQLKTKIEEQKNNDLQDNVEIIHDLNSHFKNMDYPNSSSKVIMHIDMDCFFVSVGLRNKPELKGSPVAVTHSKGLSSGSRHNAITREIEKEYYKNRINQKTSNKTNSLSKDEKEEILIEDLSVIENEVENNKLSSSSSSNTSRNELSCSEIACCSYEARETGIHNGMFLGDALKLCPSLKTIPYDFEGYREVSYILYDTIASYTHSIEAVSCDELYVDCTDILEEMKIEPLFMASVIREEVARKTGCTCSAGLGSNMLLARLATKKAKPNGQYLVDSSFAEEFIKQFTVKDLPGIGWSLSNKLHDLGIESCEDLQKISVSFLQAEFGPKTGFMLYNFCRGIDNRHVNSEHQRKSVSAEVNYGIRFNEQLEVFKFIGELSDEVCKRLQSIRMKGKTITFKLKVRKKDAPVEPAKFMGHGICDSVSRSASLSIPTDNSEVIKKEVEKLYQSLAISPSEMRGMGIQVQKLYPKTNVNSDGQSIVDFIKKSEKPSVSTKSNLPTNSTHYKDSTLSFSQIDHEVFNALPKEIQEELNKAYKNKPSTQSPKKKTVKSPPKGKKIQSNKISNFIQQPNTALNKTSTEQYSKKAAHATFCGVDDLTKIKSLLQEWTETCEEPQPDDVTMVSDYLKALVLEKNLERADIIIRCLSRLINNVNGDGISWKNSYDFIVKEVQELIINLYGAPLKMS